MQAMPTEILSGETVTVDLKKIDYTTEYRGGPSCTMHLLGRTKGGTRVHIKDPDFQPYFYVPKEEFDSYLENHDKVTGWERGFENISGDEAIKVYTRIPGDVPDIRGNYDHLEADILFPNRYLIDNGIEDAIEIPKEHANPEPSELSIDDIEPVEADAKTRICFCDIEVYNKEGFPNEEEGDMPITSIAVYDNYLDEYRVYLYHPELPEVHHDKAEVYVYGKEHKMLLDFCNYVVTRGFDLMAGWNFADFDSRYILNRLDTLNDELDDDELSKRSISYLDSAYDDGWFGGKIKGMSVFDMLMAYKNLQFTELDSFKLESVAQDVLGEGKMEYNRELWELWEDDPQALIDYNVIDVELTVKLERQEEIIKFNEAMASYVGGRVAEVIDPSNAVDIKVLRQVNGEYVVPSAKNIESEDFEGGQVFDPITGVRDNVIVLDLKSLYPMSMKTINAGPRTKDPNGDIEAPNGINFTTERKSIVVDIIDELLEEREKLKNKRDSFKEGSQQYDKFDRQQGAVKIVMNCFSSDTDVMTHDGIKNIKNIEVGDEVYSIDPESKEVEIKSVTNTIKQKNEYGRLEHICTNNTDLKITPNHRMVVDSDDTSVEIEHFNELPKGVNHTIPVHQEVDGERIDTKDIIDDVDGRFWVDIDIHGNSFRSICPDGIYNRMHYSQNRTEYCINDTEVLKDLIDWNESRKEFGSDVINSIGVQYEEKHSTIPITYDMDNWLELLGWVISEGSFNSVDSKQTESVSYRGESDRLQIAQEQSEYRRDIVELVDMMSLNYSTDSNGVYLYNSNIHNILKGEVGHSSHDKQIPGWVFESGIPAQQLKKLLFALIDGDGDKTGKESFRYTTASEQLKEDVMQLAVLCGYKVSSSEDSGVHRVYINKNKGSFKRDKNDSEQHDGNVYCIEVEDNQTLMAGRNGKFQWTGNTLYGVLGWDQFRLYDKDVGAAVTAVGRECIKYTEQKVEEKGYKVIYGDTDSVMIELGSGISKDEILEIGYELEEVINEAYDEFAKEELNVDEHFFEIEFEKVYRKYFQAGKKKRYAGHIIWKEGKEVDKNDIVGFETNRSDYSPKAKELMKKVFDIILSGGSLQDVSKAVNKTITDLKSSEVEPDQYGIPSSVTKNFDDYDSPTLAVRASEYSNKAFNAGIQPGDKPKGMYVSRVLSNGDGNIEYDKPPAIASGSMYICWMDYNDVPDCYEWDWETYIDKQLKAPLERILKGTDWSWQEVRSGKRQPGLGEYEFKKEEGTEEQTMKVGEHKQDNNNSDFDTVEIADEEVDIEEIEAVITGPQSALDEYDEGDNDGEVQEASMIKKDRDHADLKHFMGDGE